MSPQIFTDVQKMLAVGLIWGITNAFMKKGAVIWDKKLQHLNNTTKTPTNSTLSPLVKNYTHLVLTWQYSLPLLLNLSASATFFAILGNTPISLAVPVTNATTFAATAVAGIVLGEETKVGFALVGTFVIVLGVWLCVM